MTSLDGPRHGPPLRPFEGFALPSGIQTGALQTTRVSQHFSVLAPALTPESVADITDRLLEAGDVLATRPVLDLAATLGRVGARFGTDGDPYRTQALELLPKSAAISPEMARAVLDGMARDWTGDRLGELVRREFDDPSCFDAPGGSDGSARMAFGPTLCVQIVSGSVPGVGMNALLRSLLVRAPTLLKPGLGDVVLPMLFARALREEDSELADALAITYWPGGSSDVEAAAMAQADVTVVYGSDESVRALRSLAPVTARFVAYHHRVSVGVIGRDALVPAKVEVAAGHVARSAAMFDQRGCVCPQVVYVEEGGEVSPADFLERLAVAMAAIEEELPGVDLDVDDAAALHQLRGTAEMLSASGSGSVLHGGDAGSWTLFQEGQPVSGMPTVGRFVRVRAIADVGKLANELRAIGPHLQSVGFTGLGGRESGVAATLGVLGASRVVPLASMPFPPPWWLHDGRGPLRELVRWTEVEQE